MAHPPALRLIYDVKNFPTSANCTACGEEMPRGELRTAFIGEKRRWFKAQFDLHREQKHLSEGVNHAAALIIPDGRISPSADAFKPVTDGETPECTRKPWSKPVKVILITSLKLERRDHLPLNIPSLSV
jgi:hypothetical protein